MTDAPPGLAAAYIRESTEEHGRGYSPDAQRVAIQEFAESNDLVIVEEYVDFHSAWRGSEDRPEFQRLMRDAADKRFSSVIVYHTSRFARDQALAKKYKRFLRNNGVRIISVTQPLGDDPSEPSAFIVESIHEMFDEYHSVTQSFWVSAGLHEKQRQGFLVGSLPWGYKRGATARQVVLDLKRAPLVRELFQRYATGNYSDRDLAGWLNSTGARTSKGNPFTKDTVREMLSNAAYAGYVTSRRSKETSRSGAHPAIVHLATFERVQEIRLARTKTLKPGRPGVGYALSKLLFCSCGARMHGSTGGRNSKRRYVCSGRKQGSACAEPAVGADEIEALIATYIQNFSPPHAVKLAIIRRLREVNAEAGTGTVSYQADRARLEGQRGRLKDLYVMGDMTKDEYTYKRQILEHELAAL
jgi:site-specific DNA recombinase